MEEASNSQQLMITTIIAALLVSVVLSFVYWLKNQKVVESEVQTEISATQKTVNDKPVKKSAPSKPVSSKKSASRKTAPTAHPLYVNMLRGHTDTILDMDLDQSGKLLATASNDGTVRIWYIKDMDKGKDIKYTRIPLETAPCSASISPDSKAVAVLLPVSNTVAIYRLGKKPGDDASLVATIDNIKGDLKDVAISPTGRFIMVSTVSTTVYIYTLKGELLHVIDTAQIINGQVSITP